MATTLNAGTSTSGAAISADTTGILQLQSGSTPTTAVTIDASQNVGIGTGSPASYGAFAVRKATSVGGVNVSGHFSDATLSSFDIRHPAANIVNLSAQNSALTFDAGSAERARIDSSGNLLVGQTATGTATGSTGVWAGSLTINPNLNTSSGSANVVWSTPSGLFYRSTSSIRYKENVENAVHGLQEVLQLRPVTYNGKSDIDGDKRFGGFIAEEVDAIGLTEFVVYDEENKPDSLGYDRMVSLLTKAIQEQQALIQDLTTRLAALEAK